MFYFIGSSKDECKKELARLRPIIEDFRNNKTPGKTTKNSNNSNESDSNISRNRKRLLDADRSLKRLYEEFVDKDKIMTSDDFWYIITIIITITKKYHCISLPSS